MNLRRLLTRSRPRFWLYLAGPVIVGAVYGAGTVEALVTPTSVVLFAYFLVPANLFLYGLNDVFDADADRTNPKKSGREIAYRGEATTRVTVLLAAMLGIALVAVVPSPARPWIIGFLVLGAAYSMPPIRLKTTPPLDSLSNGLYVLPGMAAYAALAGTMPPVLPVVAAWLWAMAMHTFSAIPDIDPDRRAGLTTTATVLGHRRAVTYCGGAWLFAAIAMWLFDWRIGLVFLGYPLLLAAIVFANIQINRAYWWYPTINTLAGMLLTIGGLVQLANG